MAHKRKASDDEYFYVKFKKRDLDLFNNLSRSKVFDNPKDASDEMAIMKVKLEAIQEYTATLIETTSPENNEKYYDHIVINFMAAEEGLPKTSLSIIVGMYFRRALVASNNTAIFAKALLTSFSEWFHKHYSCRIDIGYFSWIALLQRNGYALDVITYNNQKQIVIPGLTFHPDYIPIPKPN